MTELELQRIVDGEMTSAERARCLKQLDDQSPQWRTLALGLLADQDLRRYFRPVEAEVSRLDVATASSRKMTHTAAARCTSCHAARDCRRWCLVGTW